MSLNDKQRINPMAPKIRYKAPTTDAERIIEARDTIARLQETLNQGNNRFGSYGDAIRDSIKKWETAIVRLGERV
jgi:hypothetical protein